MTGIAVGILRLVDDNRNMIQKKKIQNKLIYIIKSGCKIVYKKASRDDTKQLKR